MVANDTIVPIPGCDALNEPVRSFWIRPDTSRIVYECAGGKRFEGSTELTGLDGFRISALGPGLAALMVGDGDTVTVRSPTGNNVVTKLSGLPWSVNGYTARSRPGGFWIFGGEPCSLKLLKYDGKLQDVGVYADIPSGVDLLAAPAHERCSGRIDLDGSLLRVTFGATNERVVVRRPLVPGAASVLRSPAMRIMYLAASP